MDQRTYDRFFSTAADMRGDFFAYAFSITKTREDAEDAVHNAIIKAFDGLPALRSHKKLKPWLFSILRNECLSMLRQKKRFTPLEEELPAPAERSEDSLDIENCVAVLGTELREAVVLYYNLGYSTAEIAKLTGTPRSTVMSRLARARELIKKRLEGEKYDG
ncbi:MAG: RNA polymerase sigma factor [Clostridia bacterium]|nr:RNA polymerase sigma factor [Clostridia bacterium]